MDKLIKRLCGGLIFLLAVVICMPTEADRLADGWRFCELGELPEQPAALLNAYSYMKYDDGRWRPCIPGARLDFSDDTVNCVQLGTRISVQGEWGNPMLFFVTYNEAVRVFLDGTLIYHDGEFGAKNRVYGTRWHLLSIPPGYQGKELIIQMYSEDQGTLGMISDVSIDDGLQQMQKLFNHDGGSLLLGPLALITVVLLLLNYWIGRPKKRYNRLFLAAYLAVHLVCMVASLWTVLFWLDNPVFLQYVAMISFYAIPLPLGLAAYNYLASKGRKYIAAVMAGSVCILLAALVGELMGWAVMSRMASIQHICYIAGLLVIAYCLFRQGKGGDRCCRIFFWPVLATAVMNIAEWMALYSHIILPPNNYMHFNMLPMIVYVIWLMNHTMEEEKRLSVANQELEQTVELEKYKAQIDPLTKSFTREKLGKAMDSAIKMAEGANIPFALLMIDIDKFKSVNDTYGHAAGDKVLLGMADLVRSNLDSRHTFIRYGGEEFMVICSMYTLDRAWKLAETIRTDLEAAVLIEGRRITCSIGISYWHIGEGDTPEAMQKRADAAAYYAKNNGRNCCVMENELC
ncbi:MAG: diguanylate cyclase [Anaerovibrio sp.]